MACRYLILEEHSGPFISLSKAHLAVSSACLSYLNFNYFDESTLATDEEVDKLISTGDYVLYDYVSSHWLGHIRDCLSSAADDPSNIIDHLDSLLRARWNNGFTTPARCLAHPPPEFSAVRKSHSKLYELLERIADFVWHSKITTDYQAIANNDPLTLTKARQRVHERFDVVASQQCTAPSCGLACENLHQLYGRRNLFCCPIISCPRYQNGFQTILARNRHREEHQRSFKCVRVNCDFNSIGFRTEAELEQHNADCASAPAKREEIPIPSDWKQFDDTIKLRILLRAAETGESRLVRSLLGAPTKGVDYIRLLEAAAMGGSKETFILIQRNCPDGVFTPEGGHIFLRLAIQIGRSQSLAEYLVEEKVMLREHAREKGYRSSALHLAIVQGWDSFVEYLIDKGADIECESGRGVKGLNRGSRPLHAAVACGSDSLVSLLLDKGASIDSRDCLKRTPLHLAVRGSISTVRLLLERTANTEAKDSFGRTALDHFIAFNVRIQGNNYGKYPYEGPEAILGLLLDHSADVNTQGGRHGNALYAAAFQGNEAVVRFLLDHGADVNTQSGRYGNALQAAAYQGNEAIVRHLLDHGADVNTQGGTCGNALRAAVFNGYEAIVRLLLDHGADVNAQSGQYGNALQTAVRQGNDAIVCLLLDHGVDISAQGSDILKVAVSDGKEAIIRLLLDHGANVNTQCDEHGNILLAATSKGDEAVVRLLLDYGTDVNTQGGPYGNALQAAVFNGYEAIVRLLLDHGVNTQTYGNALQAAASEATVRLLLDWCRRQHSGWLVWQRSPGGGL
jgi:ankyrin repeat protein